MTVLKDIREISDRLGFDRDEIIDGIRAGDFECMSYDDALERAKEYIRESVWAFNADFLVGYFPEGLTTEDIDSLRGDKCESVNSAFLALIDDFDTFADDAIACDGLGHFLSSYDGNYIELTSGLVVWRVN